MLICCLGAASYTVTVVCPVWCFGLLIMKTVLGLVLLFLVGTHSSLLVLPGEKLNDLNNRPIIGVLTQEPDNVVDFPKDNFTSYIAASYVKNIEASGARVVPIMIGRDRSYYETLLRKLNGVLLPGGNACFGRPNGYADAGQLIYEITKKINDEGEYFPLFGGCLGFELIMVLASGRGDKDIRTTCNSHGNLPLEFSKNSRKSKMFSNAPEYIIDLLKHNNLTINNHDFCIVEDNLKSFNLTEEWLPSSYGSDNDGMRFISSIENTKYPIYGIQFHPEKVPYEWLPTKDFVHTSDALIGNRYFMDFFVNESRKNRHRFSSDVEEDLYLIYNYESFFTGSYKSYFVQTYLFDPRGVKSNGIQSQRYHDLDLTPVEIHC